MVRFAGGASLLLEASWAGHLPDVETFPQMILGEKGGATIVPFGSPTPVRMFTSRDEALVDIIPQGFPEVQPHVEEIKHWIACLRGEAEVLVKPEESLNVQRILDGLYLSSEKGREIVVAEELPGATAGKPEKRKKAKAGR
jgi:predicted dehydrogenase